MNSGYIMSHQFIAPSSSSSSPLSPPLPPTHHHHHHHMREGMHQLTYLQGGCAGAIGQVPHFHSVIIGT